MNAPGKADEPVDNLHALLARQLARQPQAIAQAIDANGWFSSGDIGHRRADGSFVYLTRAMPRPLRYIIQNTSLTATATKHGQWLIPQ